MHAVEDCAEHGCWAAAVSARVAVRSRGAAAALGRSGLGPPRRCRAQSQRREVQDREGPELAVQGTVQCGVGEVLHGAELECGCVELRQVTPAPSCGPVEDDGCPRGSSESAQLHCCAQQPVLHCCGSKFPGCEGAATKPSAEGGASPSRPQGAAEVDPEGRDAPGLYEVPELALSVRVEDVAVLAEGRVVAEGEEASPARGGAGVEGAAEELDDRRRAACGPSRGFPPRRKAAWSSAPSVSVARCAKSWTSRPTSASFCCTRAAAS
eukprot:10856774-Lingulodinium_polyedra.AAC.1